MKAASFVNMLVIKSLLHVHFYVFIILCSYLYVSEMLQLHHSGLYNDVKVVLKQMFHIFQDMSCKCPL